MEKRWSIPLIGKIFIIRDTIEQSVFYIALALIMLCAILFLAVPSVHGMKMNKTASDLEDMTITLAGAGTEYSDETAGPGGNSSAAVHLDLAAGCFENLNQAALAAAVFRQEQSLSAVPVKTASAVGYTAMNTVEGSRIMSYTDYQTLLQIVEAECTGGDERSKQYVACVVLNRTKDNHFPDTVYDVVWQRLGGEAQFSPTQDGRMGTLKISDSTVKAVNKALQEDDISQGALFFLARKYGMPLLDDLFPSGRYNKWSVWASKSKSYTDFLFMAMLLPLFPDDFLCYLTGVSKMTAKRFIWIIVLGKPWCILAYSLGFSLIK